MSFLDRFKPQPRWKHADPAVRAAAVSEIPDDAEHLAVLDELATADEDVRVRRAAIDRIDDVEVLVRLARAERDEDLRRALRERLVAIAVAPAATDAEAARALEGIDEQKQCATIAKSSPHDTVRTAALARVHDVRLLGSVARNAADGQTALEAVARIPDATELLNVALKTEHKDAGIAALERAAEATATEASDKAAGAATRDILESAAARAKSKPVVKRARAMLQAMDDAEAARRLALEQWQHQMASILARVEALAAAPSSPDAREQLAAADDDWRRTSSEPAFELDPDTSARFGALVDSARGAIETCEREQAERRAREERVAAQRAQRAAACERIEQIRGEDAMEQIDLARAEWEGLEPMEEQNEAEIFTARFDDACRRAAERFHNRQQAEQVSVRLETLSHDAERVTSADEMSPEAWGVIAAEWASLIGQADALDPAITQRYENATERVRQREEDARAASERTVKQQVQRVDQLIERATARAAAENLTLREADRIARDLRAALDAPPALPEPEQQALIDRVRAAQATIGPRLHELREMDEWKRFANAAVQEELIARTEGLAAKYGFERPDGPTADEVEKAGRELREIQERWKLAAEAPRAQAQALWHRYRQAADPVQAKARELYAQQAGERHANLERKVAIIERAEALADSTDWVKTAEELKKLQHEWQALGPVPRQDTRATWKRFREACDQFFTRRNADLTERKETWSANLARKEALIARAEELSTSTEWERGASEIRRLQADWKNVGPVRRNKSEAVWQRFRAACDTFFDRYKRRDEIELESRHADREALVLELEALGVPPGEAPASPAPEVASDIAPAAPGPLDQAALLERVRSLRNRWNQTSPAVRHGADPLSARFMTTLERLISGYPEAFHGTELDVEGNRQKMEKLIAKVEGFLKDTAAAAPASSSQALADMLREALASNTIGGRAGEESKWRAMAEDVRQAQASWSRLGPVPGDMGRQLGDRFHRACSRFFDLYRKKVPQTEQRRGPVGAR